MEDIIDIIVTETTNLIEITSQPTDEIIDVNIIDNREDVTLNVTPTLVEININSLTGNFGILWGEIEGTLSNQTDLQNVLNLKADLVDGKVPSSQLPSYVDDVVEVANYAALPVTGEVGKIYITLDTNYIYRWTGSTYVEIKDSSAVWGAITGTLSNQTDLQNALNAKQDDLNGTGFVKASGTTITYDNTSYLPLTGGTLTGNLNGTNITISNSLIAKGGTFNGGALSGGVVTIDGLGSDLLMNRADTSNGASITFLTSAVEKWNIGLRSAGTTDNFFIYNSNLTANALTINSATSAATFASSATATNFILSGGTGNTGLYYGHTDRVVLANYTTGGIDFEVNGGSIVATLFPSGNYGLGITLDAGYKLDVNGTTRISGALNGTSATFSGISEVLKINGGGTSTMYQTFNTTGGNYYIGISSSTGAGLLSGVSAYSMAFVTESARDMVFGTNNTARFTIASTGAATFSSSVTAGGRILTTASGNDTFGFQMYKSGTSTTIAGFYQNTTGDGLIAAYNSSGTQNVQIATNGVSYFNGGNVGIGTTAPERQLHVVNSAKIEAGIYFNNTLSGSGAFLWQEANESLRFGTNNTERMRITPSGNVGIGTTVISQNFSGYTHLDIGNATTGGILLFSNAGGTNYGYINGEAGGVNMRATVGNLTFNTGGSERMRITSSGNVGIGTIPQGVGTAKTLEIGSRGLIYDNNDNFAYVNNAYNDGSWRYKQTGFATILSTDSGNFVFSNASSGSQGSAISFSERMRITSTGVVAIGTTSNVAQTGETLLVAGDNGVNTVVVRRTGASNTNASRILFQAINASSVVQNTGIIEAGLENSSTAGYLAFFSSTTERMRITSGGNVGIGTTSPTVAAGMGLVINGGAASPRIALKNNASGDASTDGFQLVLTTENEAVLENRENASMRFLTNATEAMRITSGGNLFVGATTQPGAGNSTTGASLGGDGYIAVQRNAATVGYFGRGTNDGELFAFYRSTTQVGSISVTTVMTSYNVTSDYRLKEDLKPINGLEIVNKIKVYDYKWKADNSRMDGVLAHELQEVLPYAVTGVKDGEQMQSVDYSKIVPVLIQSIKELKSKIETLENK